MQFFAIRNNATGQLLPLHRIAMTRVEFGDSGPPRLFTKRNHAQNALNCWREGRWRLTGDEDGYYPEPSIHPTNTTRSVERKAMDVSVVPVELEVLITNGE